MKEEETVFMLYPYGRREVEGVFWLLEFMKAEQASEWIEGGLGVKSAPFTGRTSYVARARKLEGCRQNNVQNGN
jgi:hypothetical protein